MHVHSGSQEIEQQMHPSFRPRAGRTRSPELGGISSRARVIFDPRKRWRAERNGGARQAPRRGGNSRAASTSKPGSVFVDPHVTRNPRYCDSKPGSGIDLKTGRRSCDSAAPVSLRFPVSGRRLRIAEWGGRTWAERGAFDWSGRGISSRRLTTAWRPKRGSLYELGEPREAASPQ